jgi:ABC-type phosphate transport system substrate-binding protein
MYNRACALPGEIIRVIARYDKSGTTGMFTEALASFSSEWAKTYGVFSAGIDEATGE